MTPRMRMLAGPNGSGKSTLAAQLTNDYAVNLYAFLNADALFAAIVASRKLACPFPFTDSELREFVAGTSWPERCKEPFETGKIRLESNGDYLIFSPDSVNSYSAAMVADFFREQYLKRRLSFSFETVFSHPAKIAILERARHDGYRTYLYFVATETPQINVKRIEERVVVGGHDVPEEKILARYDRCLRQIKSAMPWLDRAYFFDNSGTKMVYLAECQAGGEIMLHSDALPFWFRHFVLGE